MKKLFIVATCFIFTQTASAGGYFCQAFCVSIDSSRFFLHVLGQVETERGGKDIKAAHRQLKKECGLLARAMWISRPVFLVDEFDFYSTRIKPSKEDAACEYDEHIDENYRPYLGDIGVM